MREYDPQLGRFPQLDPLTDEFPTLTPYQYASNDPVANIDWDGLEGLNVVTDASKLLPGMAFGVVNSTAVVISAAKPLTTSLKVVKGASVLSKVEEIASPALHVLQSARGAIVDATRQVGHSIGAGWNRFNNAPFWQTGAGKAVYSGGNWINENINLVYLLFNGINSQFTGKDYLTGNPESHTEGAAQLLSLVPVGDVARVASIGVESAERIVMDVGEKEALQTGSEIEMHHLLPQAKEFEPFFKRARLDVEDYQIPLEKWKHRLRPYGIHTNGGGNWNKVWRNFFRANPNANKSEILQQLSKMRKDFGI